MKRSAKLDRIPPYLFAEVDRKIAEKRAEGVDVISFGIGDPDLPTPDHIVKILREESLRGEHHRYPDYYGLDRFREAAAGWLERRFGVTMHPKDEMLSLIGAKEGVAHLALAILDPGDIALVPEPSYPVYETGTILAGAETYHLPLNAANGFLPDLDSVPRKIAKKAKILWINYPNNPTGAVATDEFFRKAIEFAHKNDLLLAHDNAYSEITFDGYVAPSIFEYDGAREVGIEIHSLSKSFNMTGWRIGFACGNADAITALGTIKTNIDSGVFNPIQLAAVEALENGEDDVRHMVDVYKERRDTLVSLFEAIGWKVSAQKGTIFIWMPVPEGFDSVSFSTYVLDRAGLFFTPGTAYGPSGEGFVRLSLTLPDERIHEAVDRLKEVF